MKAKIIESAYDYDSHQSFELYVKKHWWSSWVYKGCSNTPAGVLVLLAGNTENTVHVIMSKSIINSLR